MEDMACNFYSNKLCKIVSKEDISTLYEIDDLYIFSIKNGMYEKCAKELG